MTTREVRPYPGFGIKLVDTGTDTNNGTVLILHGVSGPAGVSAIVQHLTHSSRVLAPTHPGWGGTYRPGWFTGVDRLAATYLHMLKDIGVRDVVVIGHSFGGWVATALAVLDHSHLIRSLVLIDAIGPAFAGHEIPAPQPPPGHGPSSGDVTALQAYTGPLGADPGLRSRLSRVRVPALLIWGEDDVVVPPAFGRLYAEALPLARFAMVPGAGHAPMADNPEVTFALMDEFLNR